MERRIPVIAVTGPSGSGKTWLICGLAEHWSGGKVAVLSQSQQGPVHLDPLLYPPDAVQVQQEEGCDCCGEAQDLGSTLAALNLAGDLSLVLLEMNQTALARPLLRELPDDGRYQPLVLTVSRPGMEGDAGQKAEADRVVQWVGDEEMEREEGAVLITELVGGAEGLEGLLESGDGDDHDHDHVHDSTYDCGSDHEGDDHDHGEDPDCSCHSLGAERAWYPFFTEGPVEVAGLLGGLAELPEAVKRVQGVMQLGAGEGHSVVDATAGSIQVRQLDRVRWPVVLDPDLMEEALDYDWLEDSSVLLAWAEPASEAEEVDLELSLHSRLGRSFLPDQEEAMEAAAAYLEEEAFLEGITAARAAAAGSPTSAERLELLAKCYHRLGENRRAFALLRRALSHEPQNRSVLLNLGRLHLVHRQTEEAIQTVQRVLDGDPADAEALALLGQGCLEAGDLERGVELLLQVETEDEVMQRSLVAALADLGRADEALAQLQKVLATGAGDEGLSYMHGHLLLQAGRAKEAARALEEALALGNDFSWVHRTMGAARWLGGDEDRAGGCFLDALASARQHVEDFADDPSFAVDLLLAEALTGGLDLAEAHRELWASLGPEERGQLGQELRLLQSVEGLLPRLEPLVEIAKADMC